MGKFFFQFSDPFMYVGPLIHSLSLKNLEFIPDGIIVVRQGKIIYIENNSKNITDIQTRYEINEKNVHVLKKGQFIIPGFVDTHIHGPQYPNIGLGYDLPLLQWLNKYTFPLEKKFENEKFAEKVYNAVISRTLANGTTTASYFATIHKQACFIFADCLKNRGQRAFIGKVNMNKNVTPEYGETHEESISDTKAVIEYILNLKSPLIKPIVTPRFALSCDMTLLKALGDIAQDGQLPVQTHLSENTEEILQVKKEFPECKNYVEVYDRAGLLTDRTILAHGVYLEPEELSVIKERKSTISHCPSSNTLLQSGICPVYQYLQKGLKVSLGTDCSGGNSCSILECMRQTLMLSIHASFNKLGKKLSIEEVFYMATLGGAEALGLENTIGNFRVGKEFDAILVDLNDSSVLDLLEDYNLQQLFHKFIYLGNDRIMKKVFIAGKVVKHL